MSPSTVSRTLGRMPRSLALSKTASVPVTGKLSRWATLRAFLSSRMSLAADHSIDRAIASDSPAPKSKRRD